MLSATVVGLGAMGFRHAEALNELGIEIAGGVDLAHEALDRARASASFSEVPMFVSLEEALSQRKPDLLTIASTAPAHADAIEAGIDAGVKLILVEKPLTTSLMTAVKLRDLSLRNGSQVAVNHQSRFLDRYRFIRSMSGSEEFGDLRSMSVFGSDFGVAMNGIHFVEIFEWLSRERIDHVLGDLRPSQHQNPRGAQFQDYEGVFMAWTPSNRRLHIDCSHDMGHGISLAFGFETGKIVWDELTGQGFSLHRRLEDAALPSYRYGTPSQVGDLNLQVEDLVRGTRSVLSALIGQGDFPTIEDGQSAMQTLVGAITSSELGGRRISLEELPRDQVFRWA